jgi:uncharacterized protein YbdZ (MbtH family)
MHACWTDVGKSGTKEECLAYIKEVWTDMRPLRPAPANGKIGTIKLNIKFILS